AKRLVVHLLREGDEQVRGLRVDDHVVKDIRFPRNETGRLPSWPNPDAEQLVGIVARETLDKIWLIIEEAVLYMRRERHRMKHEPTGLGQVMHDFEKVLLVEQMLRRAVIGHEVVFADMLGGAFIEVEIKPDRAELRIDVDAMENETERSVQFLRRTLPVREPVEHILRWLGLVERAKQILYEFRARAPNVLSAELHHVADAVECA